jgi:hypothetical protein
MNKNQAVILWVFGVAVIYTIDLISGIMYLFSVAPPILYHARTTYPRKTSVEEMEHADSHSELENDEVTVDSEYTERIELEIGGYVELECWKEVPFNDASKEEKRTDTYQQTRV